MRYLTAGDICRIHELEVGAPGLPVDFGLLESAVLRPQSEFTGHEGYTGVHQKAAALVHGLIKNHPFRDGNKRAAIGAVLVFYNLNGFDLAADDSELVEFALRIAEHQVELSEIARWLEERTQPLPLPD